MTRREEIFALSIKRGRQGFREGHTCPQEDREEGMQEKKGRYITTLAVYTFTTSGARTDGQRGI